MTLENLRAYLGLSNLKNFFWGVNNISFRSIGPNVAYPLGYEQKPELVESLTQFPTNKPLKKGREGDEED